MRTGYRNVGDGAHCHLDFHGNNERVITLATAAGGFRADRICRKSARRSSAPLTRNALPCQPASILKPLMTIAKTADLDLSICWFRRLLRILRIKTGSSAR